MVQQQGGAAPQDADVAVEAAEPAAQGAEVMMSSEPAPPDPEPEPAPPARRPGRRAIVVAGSVAGLAVLTVGAVVGLPILRQKDATLTAPDRAAGLVRDDSTQADDAADYLRTALAAEVSLEETEGAVYNDPADTARSVLFFGGTSLVLTPERELDNVFELLGDKTGSVTDVRDVPPGDLGGTMKCGAVNAPEGAMAVCGWADHGSVAVAMFPGRPIDQAATLMRDLRGAIQKRD
jgi:hypothetical protein